MERPALRPENIRFGLFEVDIDARELRRDGVIIRLQEQPFSALVLLLQSPGRVVTREQLREQLWPTDVFVDFDRGISSTISRLRDALGDSAAEPRYIQTVGRRGYRWIAPINPSAEQAVPPQSFPSADLANKFPASRYSSKTVLLAVVVLVFLLAGIAFRSRSRESGQLRSVAVLPFKNLSGNPDQEYLTDGMTDELITDLAKLSSLRVISHTSVMQFKQTTKSLPEIARELNVDAIIEGSVQNSTGGIHVNAQLVQVRPEKHLWAESYDRSLGDAVALQEELARNIAGAIRINLSPEQRVQFNRHVSPKAYQLYLRGLYFWNKRTAVGLEKSLEYFQQAIDADPAYALAYSGLANSYTMMAAGEYAVLPASEAVPKARAAAERALQLDDTVAEAHATLGFLKWSFDWNWQRAENEYKRAIELNPSYATAHQWFAIYLVEIGRSDDAVAEIRKAEALDPLSLIISTDVGWVLYNARRYDDAIRQLAKPVELDPSFASAHWTLGLAYDAKGMSQEAIAELQKAVALSGGRPVCRAALGHAYAAAGMRDKALQISRDLESHTKDRYVLPDGPAYIYTALGDYNEALNLLEQAYVQRTDVMPLLKVEPRLDPLRSDPRFVELLHRINFP